MKRRLKSFPVKGSTLNNKKNEDDQKHEENNEKIANNLEKTTKFAEISEGTPIFEDNSNSKNNDEGFKLHSELLGYLRKSQNTKILDVCRKIDSIRVYNQTAKIIGDSNTIALIEESSETQEKLTEFFKTKGLSFVVVKSGMEDQEILKLKKLLNGNITIK